MTKPGKIFINGRFLTQPQTGVQKYALGISRALQTASPEVVVVVPAGVKDAKGLKVRRIGGGKGSFWEQFSLPWFMLFQRKAVLINLCNTAPLLLRNEAVTIHDLAFLKNEAWFSPGFRRWYRFLLPRISRKAKHIFCVTETMKREVAVAFSLIPEKIYVVPNGVPEMHFDEISPFPFRYLFLSGVYNPRKNAGFVISLLAEIKGRNLHVAGTGAEAGIFGHADFPDDDHLHLLPYAGDRQYYTYMKHAEAIIFPSHYEGFGIPVLEALLLGRPVIVPDLPVYRESFGDMPLYYTAGDGDSFLKTLDQSGTENPEPEKHAVLKNRYNFERSGRRIMEILNQVQDDNSVQDDDGVQDDEGI